MELEDKVQLTNQLQEQIVLLERRCSLMTAEEDELRGVLEQTDRARKIAEHELVEVAERVNLLTVQVQTLSTGVKDWWDILFNIDRQIDSLNTDSL